MNDLNLDKLITEDVNVSPYKYFNNPTLAKDRKDDEMLTIIPRTGKLCLTMLGFVSGLNISASMLHTTTKVNASTSAILIVKKQTFFKQDYQKQAKDLPLTDKYEAQQGSRFAFAYIEPDVNQFNGHLKVHFDPALKPQQGSAKQSWYVFASDVSEIRASGN